MKTILLTLASVLLTTIISFAAESTLEKAETVKNKSADAVKRNYRAAKNQACETFNEKGECVSQKGKNEVLNLKDKTATKATEIKNKVD